MNRHHVCHQPTRAVPRQPLRATCGLLLVLASLVVLGGCAPTQQARILWPVPPEQPRIEFIGLYASQNNFPKSALQRFFEAIVGEETPAGFKSPYGIAADSQGRVFVSDLHARNLRVYDFERREVSYFSEDPIFGQPRGLAIDQEDRLYVADSERASVTVFNREKQAVLAISGDVLPKPNYVAVNDRLGRIYVSDARLHKVVVFDKQGKYLFSFGGLGQEHGQFSFPMGIAVSARDEVYVADYFNARVQAFDADGRFLHAFGERGDLYSQFEQPRALAFDSEGNLWVADNRRGSIYTYTPTGTLLMTTGSQERTDHPLGFANPFGLYIDRNDRVYVSDMLNKRFTVWQYLSPNYLAKHPITAEELTALEKIIIRSNQGQTGGEAAPAGGR